MNKIALAAVAALVAVPAMASNVPPPVAVPEISALEGTAALAAVAAVVLLVWERRRRAA